MSDELLKQCRDAMEQVLDHATDTRTQETGIPYRIPDSESIGERERHVYIPLNELDGIRMALEAINRKLAENDFHARAKARIAEVNGAVNR